WRLLVQRPSVSGVKGTSSTQGEPASRRTHSWLSGRTSVNRSSKGRNHPSSTFHGVQRSPRQRRNASASPDRIEMSMSSWGRQPPVTSSMLQLPMIHHGRSKPPMKAAIEVLSSGSQRPYQWRNSSGGRRPDEGGWAAGGPVGRESMEGECTGG